MTDSVSTHPASPPPDASMGELVAKVSEHTSRLLRDELRLAQLEMTEKGKKFGFGAGLFGGAGLVAAYGFGCLVATAILALAGPLSAWLAALIVGLILFVIAGVAAMMGKREVKQATPPMPAEAAEGVKQDVHTLKSGSSS